MKRLRRLCPSPCELVVEAERPLELYLGIAEFAAQVVQTTQS